MVLRIPQVGIAIPSDKTKPLRPTGPNKFEIGPNDGYPEGKPFGKPERPPTEYELAMQEHWKAVQIDSRVSVQPLSPNSEMLLATIEPLAKSYYDLSFDLENSLQLSQAISLRRANMVAPNTVFDVGATDGEALTTTVQLMFVVVRMGNATFINGSVRIPVTSRLLLHFNADVGTTSGQPIWVRFAVNGGTQKEMGRVTAAGPGSPVHMSLSYEIAFNAGDLFTMYIGSSATSKFTWTSASLQALTLE